jgi:hypothetical protein
MITQPHNSCADQINKLRGYGAIKDLVLPETDISLHVCTVTTRPSHPMYRVSFPLVRKQPVCEDQL